MQGRIQPRGALLGQQAGPLDAVAHLAAQQLAHAAAATAVAAGTRHLDAGLRGGMQQRLAGGHGEAWAIALELHLENSGRLPAPAWLPSWLMAHHNQRIEPRTASMSSYQVRSAVAADAARVAQVHASSSHAAYEGVAPAGAQNLPIERRRAFWRDAIEYGEPLVQVALEGDEVDRLRRLRPFARPQVQADHRRNLGDLRASRRTGARAPAWRCGTRRAKGCSRRAAPRSRCGFRCAMTGPCDSANWRASSAN